MAVDPDDPTEDTPVVTADASVPAPGAPEPVAPAPVATGPAVDDLVVKPEQATALQAQLASIKRNQMAASNAGADETITRLRADRARMEEAYKASVPAPDMLEQWDTKAKQNEYRTDPVEAFGSIGSIFAMLAPAFVGLPMEASLNAGAAAINAVHAGDEKAYNRDYTAWKDNNELAIKRHNIMRQAYTDAGLLMDKNLNAGRSEMEMAARKFGDQQALALLEAGLDPELNKLIDSRNKAALEMKTAGDAVWLQHEKVEDLKKDPNYYVPALKAKAIEDWQKRWAPGGSRQVAYDAEKDFVETYKKENPDWTSTTLAEAVAGFRKQMAGAENVEGEGGDLSSPKLKVKAIQEIMAKAAEAGNPISITEATRQYNLRVATPTGNRLADDKVSVDMYDNALGKIDSQLAKLNKYTGIAGAAGYATRAAERVSNIFGSNSTDRVAFEKDVQYLRTTASRLLTATRGRPLAAEAARINAIVSGLNLGDTGANTKRAMEELRTLYQKMQKDAMSQVDDTWKPPSSATGGPPTGKTAPRRPLYETAPIVVPAAPGPRSSLDGPVMSDADPESVEPGAQYAQANAWNSNRTPTVAKPTMIKPGAAGGTERIDSGMFELEDIAAQLSPRMQRKLTKYAEKLAARE